MAFRKVARWIGIGLVLVGLFVFAYAGLTYFQTAEAEKQAEARVPGQAEHVAQVILPTLTPETPTEAPPTATLLPTSTPKPTQPAPSPTPTVQMVVGTDGLPKGKGANPTRIVIPRMQLDTRVDEATWDVVDQNGQQVSEWQIPYDAAGHLSITPKPGERGNAVISGHNNLIAPNVFGVGLFAGLWNLKEKDPIYITDSLGRTFLFQVSKFYYVKELGVPQAQREQHAKEMMADDGTPIITLETCWNGYQAPLSGNTYRWVVRARLVGTVDGSEIPKVNRD